MRFALCLCLTVAGCGMTFGVEAVDIVHQTDADVAGATTLSVRDIGVEGLVSICGGSDRLMASVSTTEWTNDGATTDAPEFGPVFEIAGETATLVMGRGDESTTVQSATITAPASLATDLFVTTGDLRVCDFSAPVRAETKTGNLELINIAALVVATARTTIDFTIPINLMVSGHLTGKVAGGGQIEAAGTVMLHIVGDDFQTLDLMGTGGDQVTVTVHLPPALSYTLRIQSDQGTSLVDAGDTHYDSTEEGAVLLTDGLEMQIRGGGPVITIATTIARIVVRDSDR